MATASGFHQRSYRAELRLRHTKAEWARLALVFLALLVAPYILTVYWLGIANSILIAVIGAVGLNILVGFTGQISLGQGGFLAVGAYSSAIRDGRTTSRWNDVCRWSGRQRQMAKSRGAGREPYRGRRSRQGRAGTRSRRSSAGSARRTRATFEASRRLPELLDVPRRRVLRLDS